MGLKPVGAVFTGRSGSIPLLPPHPLHHPLTNPVNSLDIQVTKFVPALIDSYTKPVFAWGCEVSQLRSWIIPLGVAIGAYYAPPLLGVRD